MGVVSLPPSARRGGDGGDDDARPRRFPTEARVHLLSACFVSAFRPARFPPTLGEQGWRGTCPASTGSRSSSEGSLLWRQNAVSDARPTDRWRRRRGKLCIDSLLSGASAPALVPLHRHLPHRSGQDTPSSAGPGGRQQVSRDPLQRHAARHREDREGGRSPGSLFWVSAAEFTPNVLLISCCPVHSTAANANVMSTYVHIIRDKLDIRKLLWKSINFCIIFGYFRFSGSHCSALQRSSSCPQSVFQTRPAFNLHVAWFLYCLVWRVFGLLFLLFQRSSV